MEGENYKLFMNEFENKITSTYKKLLDDTNFKDVTFVCADNKQVRAHKAILGSSSKVLNQMLAGNHHPHPFVYLYRSRHDILESLIQFIYVGSVDVEKQNFQDFINLASELQVEGIQRKVEAYVDINVDEVKTQNITPPAASVLDINILEPQSDLETEKSENLENITIKEDKEAEEGSLPESDSASSNRITCDLCQQQYSNKQNLKVHKNSAHFGIKYPCALCSQSLSSKQSLKNHVRIMHSKSTNNSVSSTSDVDAMDTSNQETQDQDEANLEKTIDNEEGDILPGEHINVSLEEDGFIQDENVSNDATQDTRVKCELCNKWYASQGSLWMHKNVVHEGNRYPCSDCKYIATTKANLKRHTYKVHEKI